MDIDQAIRKLLDIPVKTHVAVNVVMSKAAILVRDTATKKFGEYQPAVGEFPAWEPLQPETVERKIEAGSQGDDPLVGHYAKGTKGNAVWSAPLQTTIEMQVGDWVAHVGTKDQLAEYHEYGTEHIPPRPFLRPALFEKTDEIKTLVNEAVSEALRNL
jgi:HK97 gp10 family phage protein